ncbi:glycoside hydrolase family 17 protein, partial [Patellaria atrata CBS 101060]
PTTTECLLPTPEVTICPTTGIYTFPAKTITVTEETTVIAETATVCVPGTHTYGGYTTSVPAATTITATYASVCPEESTTKIVSTAYVCPTPGEYTVGAYTTTITETETIVYPIVTTYVPATYSKPEETLTVTKTSYVYVCPYETPMTSTSATPYVPETTPCTTSSSETPYVPEVPETTPVPYVPETTPCTTSKINGKQWAMTYTPYTQDGQCKTKEEVYSDVARLASKGFTTLRLYGTDCYGLEHVGGAAKAHGVRMIVGVYVNAEGIAGCQEQVTAIGAWGASGYWSIVDLIVVGNEAIFNNFATGHELAAFITRARVAFKGYGYSGPITTTEPLNILQENTGALCGVIDVVAANIQSYFTASVSPASAGKFVKHQLELVAECCPGLDAYNLETGWPSQGSANGEARAGHAEQKAAILSIVEEVGDRSVIFSFEDDHWKEGGEFGVEKYWGCVDIF